MALSSTKPETINLLSFKSLHYLINICANLPGRNVEFSLPFNLMQCSQCKEKTASILQVLRTQDLSLSNTVRSDFENGWEGILHSKFSLSFERKKKRTKPNQRCVWLSFPPPNQNYLHNCDEKYNSGKAHYSQARNDTFPEHCRKSRLSSAFISIIHTRNSHHPAL